MSDLIFGYSWEQIQRAQQGGRLADALPPTTSGAKPPTAEDFALLAKHGEQGLRALEFHGVLDRLEQHKTTLTGD